MLAETIFPRVAQAALDNSDKAPTLRAALTALLVLATFFVGLRFCARYKSGLTYGWDDWLILLSLGICFATGGINYTMMESGLGRHAVTLQQEQVVRVLKLLVAFECVYVLGILTVKLAFLWMYMRIFPLRNFRIASYILGSITIAWAIAIILFSIFQCQPIKKAWLGPAIPGHCGNLKASFIGNAIPNIMSDIAILCMPIAQVWKLQVSPTHRATLIFMFLCGGFVLFASIYRFTTIMAFDMADTTGTLAVACTWCVIEIASGIISACLPTLRPLVMMVSSQFGSTMGRSGKGSSGGGHSGKTDLVTIGGTGGKRGQPFRRLEDGYIYDMDTVATRTHADADDISRSSSDTKPLAGTIKIATELQVKDV